MAVVIDGTTGISTPANTVLGNLSYTGTLTGNGGIVNLGSGQFYKDASGNVGIGTSSPSGASGRVLEVNGGSGQARFVLKNDTTGSTSNDGSQIALVGAQLVIQNREASDITFETNNTERARIDSSGNLLVGTTSQLSGQNFRQTIQTTAGQGTLALSDTANTSGFLYAGFYQTNTNIGVIARNGSTNAVQYVTTSDYRLKENVQPMTGALAKVAALKPCTYDWKEGGYKGQGFIAHELQEVVPDCVMGEKDAVDADGNPQYQGIDTSFLVATLTAAIQEQQTLITALTARITALEQA